MAGLFSQRFTEFGPSTFRPPDMPSACKRVAGRTAERLRDRVRKHAPRVPGIYGFLDRKGTLIYVGKAKSLRTRLMSYFREKSREHKAGRIVQNSSAIVWEVAGSEFAALLRELELIQRFLPRFNVLGKPGRERCCYVCIGRSPVPYAFVAPAPTGKEVICYGPIKGTARAGEAVRKLNHWFGLRDCPQRQKLFFSEQAELFPVDRSPGCLRFELQTCLGPCVAACTRGDYHAALQGARDFLEGRDVSPLTTLQRQMAEASSALEFERAAALRDKWAELTWLVERLTWLRQAREEHSFVYASAEENEKSVWYLTHRGQVRATVFAPEDDESRRKTDRLLTEVFRNTEPIGSAMPARQIDSVLLVSAWFRKHPDERGRLLTVAEARELCRVGSELVVAAG